MLDSGLRPCPRRMLPTCWGATARTPPPEETRALPPPGSGRPSLAYPYPAARIRSNRSLARAPRLLSPQRCSLRPRLTRGAPEPAAGFSQRKGVSGRAEVPYLFPRDQVPAPAFFPLGASCRGRGPSSWAPTCCPRSWAEGRPRISAAALRPRRLQPQCRARRLSYRRSHPPGEGSGEP